MITHIWIQTTWFFPIYPNLVLQLIWYMALKTIIWDILQINLVKKLFDKSHAKLKATSRHSLMTRKRWTKLKQTNTAFRIKIETDRSLIHQLLTYIYNLIKVLLFQAFKTDFFNLLNKTSNLLMITLSHSSIGLNIKPNHHCAWMWLHLDSFQIFNYLWKKILQVLKNSYLNVHT